MNTHEHTLKHFHTQQQYGVLCHPTLLRLSEQGYSPHSAHCIFLKVVGMCVCRSVNFSSADTLIFAYAVNVINCHALSFPPIYVLSHTHTSTTRVFMRTHSPTLTVHKNTKQKKKSKKPAF